MAAVSLPSGPVTALHPETEMEEVEGGCFWDWRGLWDEDKGRERGRYCEVTVRIIAKRREY